MQINVIEFIDTRIQINKQQTTLSLALIITITIMGSTCTQQSHKARTVTQLQNNIAEDFIYRVFDTDSIRFGDVTAYKSQPYRNQYLFTMSVRNQIDIRECVPVLNQLIHCIGCENYELKLESRAIVDIFDRKFDSALIQAKNQKTMSEFSLKIVPFQSYTSSKFKKAFYQLYLNRQLGNRSQTSVQLLDYYIYGVNPDHQAFVFLFQKCSTSLANVAQYRKQSMTPWTDKQKIKIIYEIFQSYQSLYNKNMLHRDIRPSNIFYVPSSGRFVLGNLSRARLLRRGFQQDVMSVCGVPEFSCQEMQHLMMSGQHIGNYDGLRQDYFGLKSVLNIIQTCQIYDRNPVFKDNKIAHIAAMLQQNIEFRAIMQYIRGLIKQKSINKYSEIGDRQIADSCSFLLAHRHKVDIENYLFKAYGYLGYHKNYSDKAHNILSKNNEQGKQFQNAPILKNLGDFYESKGAKGTQYYYNAFVIYIMRAQNQLRYWFPQKAQQQLRSAQQTYFKFNRTIQSDLSRIQISRVTALIELQNGNVENARKIINQTLVKAAKSNIPVQKQCKILLTYGRIYSVQEVNRNQALKKLETGITICENANVFESPSAGRIMKSKFLRQIGSLYSMRLQSASIPRVNQQISQKQIELRAQAETHLRQALQIQERQAVDDLQIADTLQELAKFYYSQQNVHDAKRYYQQTKIRLAHFKQLVNPKRQILVIYAQGSCCYYLKQYPQARTCYMICLQRLKTMAKTHQNQVLSYNIEGNLGLTLIKMGDPTGKEIVDNTLANLKQIKGEQSYDYVCLAQNYAIVHDTN